MGALGHGSGQDTVSMADGQPQVEELTAYLDGLARPGAAVSAVEVVVADPQQIRFRHAAGYRVGGERLQPGARFDAASLTKPWMATLALAATKTKPSDAESRRWPR